MTSAMTRSVVLLAACVAATGAAGCSCDGVPRNATALELHVLYDPAALLPAQFEMDTVQGGTVLYQDASPSTPGEVHPDWVVVLIYPDALASMPLDMSVRGLDTSGALLASATAPFTLVAGETTRLEVTLSAGGCVVGEVYCDGLVVMRCDPDGTPIVDETCTTACVDGACTPCTPGVTECSGLSVIVCDEAGNVASTTACTSSDPCVVADCDPVAIACTTAPAAEGAPCDDGAFCTTGETCQTGACTGGGPTDCTGASDACNTGTCDDVVAACVPTPTNEGGVCDDGLVCTTSDVCTSGTCTAGPPLDCTALDDDCNVGSCDEAAAGCIATNVNEGGVCYDGNPCTLGQTCSSGTCSGGFPPDCSAFDSPCAMADCDPGLAGGCYGAAINEGAPCDDSDTCTSGDACSGGFCSGSAPDCAPGDVRLNEEYGGTPDFIEVTNTGSCTCDLGGWQLDWGLGDFGPFTFPAQSNVLSGGDFRMVESLAGPYLVNEANLGINLSDNPPDAGWVILCSSACDLGTCANVVDYFEKENSTVVPTGMPACVSFTPAPLDVTGLGSSSSCNRTAFAGSGTAGLQSDWATGPVTRD